MKLTAFSALAATAAIMLSQGAFANDVTGDSPAPSADAQAQSDANGAHLKEGVSNAFSFGKGLFNKGVDAAKSAGSAIASQANGAQPAQTAQTGQATQAPQAGQPVHAAASPSLATTASNISNSAAGKLAKQALGKFVPGGAAAMGLAGKALDAKAKGDQDAQRKADAQAQPQYANQTAAAQPPKGDAATPGIANMIPGGGLLKVGAGFLDKLKARRADTASEPAQSNAPTP